MPTILEQLSSKNIANIKTSNGKTITEIMKTEMERLEDCINNQISLFYVSYYPKKYERTYWFSKALYIDSFYEIGNNGTSIEMRLRFDDNLSYGHSLWNGNDAYLPEILNYGWSWKHQPKNPIDRLTQYSGFGFIENGIANYNLNNPYHIKIRVERY